MKSLVIGIAMLAGSYAAMAQNDQKGLEIAQKYDQHYTGWGNYSSSSTMILKNQHGQQSERSLRGKNLEQAADGDKSMIIFDTPKDVKGTAVLTFTHKEGTDDQWLYLPAIKRIKRIASTNKSGPFVGSEFAYEDLSSQEIEKYTYKYVKKEEFNGASCEVIERDPVDPKSGYKYMHVWHNPSMNYRIEKIVFYDRKRTQFKTLYYKNYNQYLDKFWFPGVLEMVNHQTKKETKIIFSQYQFATGLTDADFT